MKGRSILRSRFQPPALFIFSIGMAAQAQAHRAARFSNSIGMEFRRIEAGSFVMRSDGSTVTTTNSKHAPGTHA